VKALVAIVAHVSENDVEEIPGVERMSCEQAVAELREINRVAPKRLAEFDIVSVQADGTLGRYVSWAL
jgi:delta-aminolevulinic acid dehydratase/porphobilinogen synthase